MVEGPMFFRPDGYGSDVVGESRAGKQEPETISGLSGEESLQGREVIPQGEERVLFGGTYQERPAKVILG